MERLVAVEEEPVAKKVEVAQPVVMFPVVVDLAVAEEELEAEEVRLVVVEAVVAMEVAAKVCDDLQQMI